jgi:uncharacterized OsmC-like protein/PAS domain-containing protein
LSSFELSPLLTLLIPALVALAALIAGVVLTLRARAQTHDSEQRLHEILKSMPLASAVIDIQGRIVEFDAGDACDCLWFTADEALGTVLWQISGTQAALADRLREMADSATRDGKAQFSCEHQDRNGITRNYDVTCSSLAPARGGPQLRHVAIRDCTKELRQQRLVDTARLRYRGLFLNAPDSIACIEYDAPGIPTAWPVEQQVEAFFGATLADCNDAYAQRIGHQHREELIGARVGDILPESTEGLNLVKRIIRNGYSLQGWYSPTPVEAAAGMSRPINHITCRSDIENDHVVRTWTVFRDITEKLGEIDAVTLGTERRESLLRADAVAMTRGGSFLTALDVGGHRLIADEPAGVGGENLGPAPTKLLSAALAACTSMTLQMYARHKGLSLDAVTTEVRHSKQTRQSGDRKETSSLFERVIEVVGELDEAQRKRLLEIADRCPVHRTLEGEVRIETRAAE